MKAMMQTDRMMVDAGDWTTSTFRFEFGRDDDRFVIEVHELDLDGTPYGLAFCVGGFDPDELLPIAEKVVDHEWYEVRGNQKFPPVIEETYR